MDLISIIVPFLNEADCITQYCDFINEFAKGKPFQIELLFVDDGSTDNTVDVIAAYDFTHCETVKVIELSKNHGSHAAVRAGIFHAAGDYITYVGADLQEPDDMVSVMYGHIKRGLDAVYIEKRRTKVPAIHRFFSLTYSALMRRWAVKNYGAGGINNIMFNRKIGDYLNNNIESNSSLMLQIIDAGFQHTTIEMDYKDRISGTSKWTFSKKIKLFIDSFVAFSFVPIRFVSIVGILMFVAGIAFGAATIINRFLNPGTPAGFATLASILAIGFGITNISLGIVAEYLWRTFDAARKRPVFIISESKVIK
ncbi:MAG: glycosyltransferase [Oscillospiraceae bacterium]|nr:glycosyltransferase [Oscillospiraceae bacterium]